MDCIINSIEPMRRKKGAYLLTLDDGRSFTIHEEVIVKYKLQSGLGVNESDLSRWIYEAETKIAYDMSLNYLGYGERSCKQLSDYLVRKGFEGQVIDDTIKKLNDYKFLDDQAFASRWVKNRSAGRHAGRRLMAYELKSKGITDDIVENALSSISDDDELRSAEELGRKYAEKNSSLPDKQLRQKVGQALMRRGYDWDTVRTVLSRLLSGMEHDE